MSNTLIQNAHIWQWDVYPNESNHFSPVGSARNGSIIIIDGIISELVFDREIAEIEINAFATVIDAKGSLVLPGLIDSHIHVGQLGESQHYVNLSECDTIEDLKRKMQEGNDKEPDLPFLIGFSWDQEKLGRLPTSRDLDDLGINKPIFLWRACWHIAVVNQKALQLAGYVDQEGHLINRKIDGGAIDLDNLGHPTGIIRERAVEPILAAIAANKTFDQRLQFIKEGLALCLQNGLTAVETNDEGCFRCYEKLVDDHQLPIRVFLTPNYAELREVVQMTGGPVPLSSTKQKLSVERVKIFSDGSLGAETAALKDEEDGYKGILIHTKETLVNMISDATREGFRIEIHAIGDAAAEQVLLAMDESNKLENSLLNRPILTHCQVLSPLSFAKIYDLGVIANIQPSFVPTDMKWVENRLTVNKFPFAYAWKTLIQNGIHVAGGSDAPIEHPSPLKGVFDAVFRTNLKRKKDSESEIIFRSEECLSLSEAIWIYTKEGAYASGYEDVIGEIKQGYSADFTIVDYTVLSNIALFHDVTPSMVMVEGYPEFMKQDGLVHVKKSLSQKEPKIMDHKATIKSDAPYIPGKAGYFQSNNLFCSSEFLPVRYCPCKFHN